MISEYMNIFTVHMFILADRPIWWVLYNQSNFYRKHLVIGKFNFLHQFTPLSFIKSTESYEVCRLGRQGKSLPKYEKAKLSETAQCVSNALQSEVEEQLRKRSRECKPSRAIFLSETITNELQTTLHFDDTDRNQIAK